MSKKPKSVKDFLETCSDEEVEYIYDLYNDMSVSELIDILFDYMPCDDVKSEIEDYRNETFSELDEEDSQED